MDFCYRAFFCWVFILCYVFCQFGISDAQTATPFSSTDTPSGTGECKCVKADRCNRNFDSQSIGGNGLELMRDLGCRASEVCCSPELIIIPGNDPSISASPTESINYDCQCVSPRQCRSNLEENTDIIKNPNCATSEICCTPDLIITARTEDNVLTKPTDQNTKNDQSTSTTSTTDISAMDCLCVSADRCERTLEDQVSGSDAIDVKKSWCGTSAICCPFDKIINSTTDRNSSPTTSTDPNQGNGPSTSEGTTISTEDCQCISAARCRQNTEDPAVSGAGLINAKNKARCSASQVCCTSENTINERSSTSTESTGGSTVHSNSDCGLRNTGSQDIFNNSNGTSFGEFPWMALLVLTHTDPIHGKTAEYIIGGASLISPRVVLTGASALWSVRNVTLLKVRVGEYNTSVGNDQEQKPHQERQVLKITKHPDFLKRGRFINLALLEVAEPFTFDYHVKPICIPSISKTYDYDPSKCLASGWGKMTYVPHPPHFTTPKKVDLTLVPNDQCQEELRKTHLGSRFHLLSSYICTKSQAGMDACQTDIGGSLVCALRNDPNRYVQVGIVSWGVSCTGGIPGVYASLEKNSDWLTQERKLVKE